MEKKELKKELIDLEENSVEVIKGIKRILKLLNKIWTRWKR